MPKVKFSRAIFQEWQSDPKATAEKFGISWNEVDRDWWSKDWKNMSYDDFEELIKKSRWASSWWWE